MILQGLYSRGASGATPANASFSLSPFLLYRRAVRPGGLLVLELSHPGELFGGSFLTPEDFVDCWEATESGVVEFAERLESPAPAVSDSDDEDTDGTASAASTAPPPSDETSSEEEEEEEEGPPERRVLAEYGREGDDFDVGTQVLRRTVGLSLFDPEGQLLSSSVKVVPQRQFSLQEVDLLARATGWKVVATHGDLDAGVALQAEGAYRMVVVLKRE